tara:strand:+ start:1225 stop:4416 length:3192 start_codon:yes stop_codon:yes gene_type:complete
MATYVPGTETYLPDIKPFTPDYKFLSAVLDTRQDKYTSNWKATNDVYNKVVYADLSRGDTTEQRDQYVENLAPSLEKIAGMDLSLAQNADSAKAVFAPFFEDDLIVRDMVYTANYRKEMDYADRLLRSSDQSQRDKYWEEGRRALQYRMEDFVNGTPEEAMSAPILKYTEDANLFKLSQQVLGEMKPPLKIKMDTYGTNPDGSVNTDWIVTQQNGELVTGPALQYIQEALQNDPRVQQAYQTEAYVASRDFAAVEMKEGRASSVKQGQNAWAQNIFAQVDAQNAIIVAETQKILTKQNKTNEDWDTYQKINGIIPGSDEDKSKKEQLSAYEATKADLQNQMQVREILDTPAADDIESNLNRAYQLIMHSEMQNDMVKAAQNYSMRDMESTMRVNKYALQEKQQKYDMAQIRARAINAQNLEATKQANRIDLAKQKGDILTDEQKAAADVLKKSLQAGTVKKGDANTLAFSVDKKGKVDSSADVHKMTNTQYKENDDKIAASQLQYVLDAVYQQNPNGVDGDQQFTVAIGQSEYKGSIEKIRNELGKKDENGNLINRDAIGDAFSFYEAQIQDIDNIKATNPSYAQSQEYADLYVSGAGIKEAKIIADRNIESAYAIQAETYEQTRKIARGDKSENGSDVRRFMDEGGMEDITYESNGKVHFYSKEEYIEKMKQKAEAGELVNVNDDWERDAGTNNKDYKIDEIKYTTYQVRTADGTETRYKGTKTGRKVVDMSALRNEAEQVYDALYKSLNSGLTGATGDGKFKTATFNSIALGRDNTIADLETGITYEGTVDPKSPTAAGNIYMADMINQINALEAKGVKPTFIQGDIVPGGDNINDGFTLGERVFEMYKADLNSYYNNPKSSSAISAMPRATIEYMPTYGDPESGEKTTAGYTITYNSDWLASKVKGGTADPTAQYGSIKSTDLAKLYEGTTVVFDQKEDINSKSADSNIMYSSPVVSQIMSNPGRYYENKPVTAGFGNTGSYRFVQKSPLEYTMNWQFREYQEGGTYILSPLQTKRISLPNANASRVLDIEQGKANRLFEAYGAEQLRKMQKDKKINGKK